MIAGTTYISYCKVCEKHLPFYGKQTNIIVCPSCGSTMLRQVDGTIKEQVFARVINESSFIHPGTTGKFNELSFQVTGGFTVWFEESVFHYWTIIFEDEELAWLAEGYGLYYILYPEINYTNLTSNLLGKCRVGESLTVGAKKNVLIEKRLEVRSWQIEGELYLPFYPSHFTLFDLTPEPGLRQAIIDFHDDRVVIAEARPVSKNDLQLSGLRPEVKRSKTFSCKTCNTEIVVKAYPYSQSCACLSCGRYYQLTDNEIKAFNHPITEEAGVIPIGSTGLLKGVDYEVIGYVQKEEKNVYKSRWREYTLYHPMEGFAFLSEYDGNWIFLKEAANSPTSHNLGNKRLTAGETTFLLYNRYSYKITNARGEFPYNIFDNGNTDCWEYIAPPEIWIYEEDKAEGISWYHGEHITGSEIGKAFSQAIIPHKSGVGAVQPGAAGFTSMVKAFFIGFVLILITHLLTTYNNESRLLMDESFYFKDSMNTATYVTDKFVFEKRMSNVKIEIFANVDNNWFELDATLVNAKTGDEYSLEKGVEYYAGYSEGEYWTEGDKNEVAYFTRVPAGTYFLQLQGVRELNYNNLLTWFNLRISYDVTSTRNLWISLLLFALCPIGMILYTKNIEQKRWENSPYSIYNQYEN